MFDFKPIPYENRARFYAELLQEIEPMLEPSWFTNLANASAAISAHLPDLNWAGFYLVNGEELVLGPFQGLPACLRIPFAKGVCGASARERKTKIVEDVHAFPGHIACDARSRSEIVVPLLQGDRLLGVLDLDSPKLARFTGEDRAGLEKIVDVIVKRTTWPPAFL